MMRSMLSKNIGIEEVDDAKRAQQHLELPVDDHQPKNSIDEQYVVVDHVDYDLAKNN